MKYSTHFTFYVLLLTFTTVGCRGSVNDPVPQVCLKDACFLVEIASTPEEMTRGLQFRDTLERDRGMLFVFPDSRLRRFWMKDTLLSLDMIWIDHARRVVDITHQALPCQKDPCPTYGPSQPAQYVLEINGGEALRKQMNIGDVVEIKRGEAKNPAE